MRKWAIAGAVLVSLLLIPLRIEYRLAHPTVPPGVQRSECLSPSPEAESSNDRFTRLGGRETRYPHAQWTGDFYTAPKIAQGRNLNTYDKAQIRDWEHFHPWERWGNPVLAQARQFLWEHWRDRRRACLTLTQSSVDYTGTSHIFVEPDDSGRWRIYRRHLDRRELIDEPTVYSLSWVKPNGWEAPGTTIPATQKPDPLNNELEFHDVCGERLGQF